MATVLQDLLMPDWMEPLSQGWGLAHERQDEGLSRNRSRGAFREANSLNLKIILSMIINVWGKPDGLV